VRRGGDRLLGFGEALPQAPDRDAGGTGGAGNYTEVNRQRFVLAKVNATGTSHTSDTVTARITNPSARLNCCFSVGFEPDTSQEPAPFTPGDFTWTLTALRPGGTDGREARLHVIEDSKDLGRAYEVETAVKLIEVAATIGVPVDGAAAAIPGRWILEVIWEPAIPMCTSEVKALYVFCHCTLNQGADLAP
jgi:hypothetical protein